VMGSSPINIDNDPQSSRHVYLPQLEDAISIQSAISEVCEMMLHRRIEPKEATALFYAMQVASTNMALLNAPGNRKPNSETKAVPSPDPKLLPPGTIQASEQPPRRKRRQRV
ncbi:MAG: hypothetical protein WBW53_09925, partial [Terriglobales bacterium]